MATNNQQPGGSPPGGGGSSSSVSYSAANSITSAGTYSNKTYSSSTADENSVLVSLASGTVIFTDPTVTKSGDSDGGDNCNFYGINSAVMAAGGGTVSIVGGTVTADAKGANGVFSYGGNGGTNGAAGDGTTVIISDTTIKTTGDNGGGIMTTGGGVMKASNLTVTTTGNSSAPIRTDRGGGSVTVSGGSYTSSGLGSPAIYSTADIVVEDATLTSNLSEGVCIEGQNSVALTNCTLTASNTKTNGNAQFLDAVILYQSQSGDAADGTSTFSMTGGTLINKSGHLFHVTNTTAVINLEGVTIDDSGDGVILSVCDDGWSGASNVATLNASGQTLDGDILVASDSTLTLNISDSSTFTGNISGAITNASGSSISTSVGTVNVSLDADSKWYLQGDTYISSFSGTAANVITGNYTLYVNSVALDGTTESENTDSGTTALNIANTVNNTLIEGSAYDDTITNSGSGVTIQALAGNDSIDNSGATTSIDAGTGNDTIKNTAANVTIQSSDGDNFIMNNSSSVTNVLIETGDGVDLISNGAAYVTITSGAGNDSVFNNGFGNAGTDLIDLGDGNDTLTNFWASNVTVDAGDGDNFIVSANSSNSSIAAGTGNDTISNNTGSGVIISAGDGDDSINNVKKPSDDGCYRIHQHSKRWVVLNLSTIWHVPC